MSNSNKKTSKFAKANTKNLKRRVLSVSQILSRVRKQKQRQTEQNKRKKPIKPIIPPKSLIIILKEKQEFFTSPAVIRNDWKLRAFPTVT